MNTGRRSAAEKLPEKASEKCDRTRSKNAIEPDLTLQRPISRSSWQRRLRQIVDSANLPSIVSAAIRFGARTKNLVEVPWFVVA
ncbi:MAG: hypothetical protein Q7S58_05160, partial [Candidatus Binatus sp.]|uniref:hypothetical protein n=1 Tax=Candidatus Binatus sp. TaxID=2811406 RepID=UPI002727CDDB